MATRILGRGAGLGILIFLFLASASTALAHPLGNFTVNHYARVEVGSQNVRVRYVLDLAEIPSIQETRAADTDGNGAVSAAELDAYKQRKAADILQQLDVTVDGQRLDLQPTDVAVSQPLGEGGVPLVRLEAWFQAPTSLEQSVPHTATFRDRTDPARIGWREVVVQADAGVVLSDSSVPALDVSDELRNYPADMLQNPLDRREASWAFSLNPSSTTATTASRPAVDNPRPTDPFTDLVSATDLNPAVMLAALLGAAVLGGIHAASPGHGKSIMAAYIVGTRGTAVHAMALALSVTLAHTTGVLVLGLLTVVASNLIFPEQLYPWLTLVSGVVVLVVGLGFLAVSVRRGSVADHDHDHDHTHTHDHEHAHDHAHAEDDHPHPHPHSHQPKALVPTWKNLFALGLAGGIVPSGSALVVLLSSISLGRLGFGLVLIVAFGFGMAVVLVATGVLLVHAARLMVRLFPDGGGSPTRQRLVALMPVFSALIMSVLGVATTFEGLSQLRLVAT